MKTNNVALRCIDNAECLVFSVNWYGSDRYPTDYEFDIEDAYCGGSGYTGFFGRLKRAWKAFRDKPVYYSSVIANEKEVVKKWLEDCLALIDSVGKGDGE